MLNQNIVREATRLTRAGQFRGHRSSAAHAQGREYRRTFWQHAAAAPARREPPTIDLKPNVVEGEESRQTTQAAVVQRRERPAPLDGTPAPVIVETPRRNTPRDGR
jgi:hypothetical protein